jgi:chromosome segregation ATPase
MSRVFSYVPRLAIFAAGIVAGVLTSSRRQHGGIDTAAEQDLKRSIADLESRLEAHESADAARFAQVETRLDEHAVKLADVPSTAQIVGAMEQLLSKTMTSLDERLTTQAHSIEALKTTVTQTDSLLERVLESLDSLQTSADPAELAGSSPARHPTV